MTIEEKIAVLTALRDGQTVQVAFKGATKPYWCDFDNVKHDFNFDTYDYRVKPAEPLVVWVNVYVDGGTRRPCSYAYPSGEHAKDGCRGSSTFTPVKFVEAIG